MNIIQCSEPMFDFQLISVKVHIFVAVAKFYVRPLSESQKMNGGIFVFLKAAS